MVLCSAATVNRIQGIVLSRGGSSFVEPSLGLKACGVLFRQYDCGQSLALGTPRNPNMMVLRHHLSLTAARQFFVFTASHRAGRDYSIDDALSF